MADPIGALNNILKGKRTLPNGGGDYTVANSTPSGITASPVDVSLPSMTFNQPTPDVPPVQEQPTPVVTTETQPGQSTYQPAPVSQPTQTAQPEDTGSVDYLDRYRQLALEQARHSSQGTGLYALQPGVQYTPDQIMAQRKSADDIYNQTLGEYSKAAQNQLTQQKKTPAYGTDSILSGLSTVGASRVNKLTDNFDSSPIVKNYNTVQNSALKAQEILNDINTRPDKVATAGDDMTLMYLFAKAQDPESVVRESEYANVADYFSSLPQNVKYQLSRVYKNTPDGRLTDQSRSNIFNNLNKLYDAQTSQYNNLKSETIRKINDVAGREVGDSLLTDYSNAYSNKTGNKTNTGGFAEEW